MIAPRILSRSEIGQMSPKPTVERLVNEKYVTIIAVSALDLPSVYYINHSLSSKSSLS